MNSVEIMRRAAEVQHDAYEHDPQQAAEVFASEMSLLHVDELSDFEKSDYAAWQLVFTFEGATEAQRDAGREAAGALLKSRGVTPYEGALAEFKLHAWDDSGFPAGDELTAEQNRAYDAWTDACRAANAALGQHGADEKGRLELWWPSKMRWEAAHERWLARQPPESQPDLG